MPAENGTIVGLSDGPSGATTVHVQGEIDAATVGELEAGISEAIHRGRSVVVDFSPVEFIDSSGIRCLLQARLEADRAGVTFRIIGVRPHTMRIFQIAGVDGFLHCQRATPGDGAASLAAPAAARWNDPGTPPLAIAN
jgi:anti-sigma B factor antagonist